MVRISAILLVAMAVLSGVTWLPAVAGPPTPRAMVAPTFYKSLFHGNFSASGDGPGTSAPALSTLTITYQFEDPSYTPDLSNLYLKVPAPAAIFNSTAGPFTLYLPPRTISINSSGWTAQSNASSTFPLANATTFTGEGGTSARGAILSTQTVSLASPLPYGALTVFLRWKWVLQPPTGPNVTLGANPWIPSGTGVGIQPDRYAALASTSGSSLLAGQTFSACVDGAIADRTFSLHAETVRPANDFVQVNATVPSNQVGPYCWSLIVPTYVAAQTIEMHLWEYLVAPTDPSNVTQFLLYSVRVNIVNDTGSTLSLFGISATQWALYGTAGILGLIVVVVLSRRARSRKERTAAPSGAVREWVHPAKAGSAEAVDPSRRSPPGSPPR